jgi:hypothetical protein
VEVVSFPWGDEVCLMALDPTQGLKPINPSNGRIPAVSLWYSRTGVGRSRSIRSGRSIGRGS